MIFERGQTIVRRHLYPDGRVGSVLCGRVVSDDERGLALWIEAGSQAMRRVDGAGQPTRRLSLLEAAEVRAEGERLLTLARAGAAPFDGQWMDFQPDPAWRPTMMPHWWELPADASCWGPECFQP
ncbi:hypothetical protein [Micromonospora sp. I033]